MTRLGFLIARSFRQEDRLQTLSCPVNDIDALFAGKSVALVGNARKSGPVGQGAMIEAADLVIRINAAPIPSAASHGNRTDILALAVGLSSAEVARIRPGRIFWMSHKRKRLPWAVARSPGFFMPSLEDYQSLKQRLGAPPSTGVLMIDRLARSRARQISIYGFDFFASLSLSGSRTATQVPHDFRAEQRFVENLLSKDSRFDLITAP
ncbi:glycosyltransferase family 29 protein [Tabrizicola sp.]|uniref:glycosyltransferase family 29 protein n=1 Tax=Tabrizicola sp. TaxID=2005166 RepID=UPI003D2C1B48